MCFSQLPAAHLHARPPIKYYYNITITCLLLVAVSPSRRSYYRAIITDIITLEYARLARRTGEIRARATAIITYHYNIIITRRYSRRRSARRRHAPFGVSNATERVPMLFSRGGHDQNASATARGRMQWSSARRVRDFRSEGWSGTILKNKKMCVWGRRGVYTVKLSTKCVDDLVALMVFRFYCLTNNCIGVA